MTKHTIQIELKDTADGSDPFDQKSEPFPNNLLACIQRVVVRNDTTAAAYAHVGLVRGSHLMWLGSVALANVNYYDVIEGPVFFKTFDRVIVRHIGSLSGDLLEAYVYGYYVE